MTDIAGLIITLGIIGGAMFTLLVALAALSLVLGAALHVFRFIREAFRDWDNAAPKGRD